MDFAPHILDLAAALAGQRVAVTGATGFVGRHLVRALLAGGAHVTCIVRGSSRTQTLPPAVRIARADLGTGHGLAEALCGQDAVIHLAALLFGLGWQDYLRDNALAADRLGHALVAELSRPGNTLRRVVLVSSLAASGPSAHAPGVNDAVAPAPVSAYGWSKFMTEQCLGRHLGPFGPQVLVTLRPPIIYGSGDKGLLPYFQSARMGLVVTPGFRRPFPVSAIHVHDMAQAIVCALKPEARKVYHCSDGQVHHMGDMGRRMAEIMGRQARVLGLPLSLMGAAAGLCSLAGPLVLKATGRAPSWNLDKYREAKQEGWLCNTSRIAAELDFQPTVSLADGLREAVDGYVEEGLL